MNRAPADLRTNWCKPVTRHKFRQNVTLGLILALTSLLIGCTRTEVNYAPNFTLPTLDSNNITLSDFHGKPIMLTFWKINCPACEFQMPHIQSFYNDWSNEKITVLTVNVGESAAAVREYIASSGLTFPVLLDLKQSVSQAYGIIGVPTTFFIDAKGILRAYKLGPFQSAKQIENVLKEVFPSLTFNPKPKVAPEVGNLAPDFTLQTIYNQTITLSTLRGKTVLLNFWVSSCAACVDELLHLQAAANKLPREKSVILAVNVSDTKMTVLSIVDRHGLTMPILLDEDGEVCRMYKRGCPTTFLIDENGIIKAIKDDAFQSPDEVESMVNSLQ